MTIRFPALLEEPLLETIRVQGGRAPLLDRHVARLRRAGIPEPCLTDIVAPHLTQGDLVVRVEIAGGRRIATTRPIPVAQPLRLVIARTPHAPYPRKTTARSVFDAALAEARGMGADDALLLTADGVVAEGTVWNLFWWEDDGPVTPPASLGILPGVARERVFDLVTVRERSVKRADLGGRSLFATNAVRGVIAIATLDGLPVPRDDRTAALAARFWP